MRACVSACVIACVPKCVRAGVRVFLCLYFRQSSKLLFFVFLFASFSYCICVCFVLAREHIFVCVYIVLCV